MELKTLEDFVSLAETGSFTKAANFRHVTQPAFSRRIKSLENWFGVTLVDRSRYPTKLTPEGEDLYKVAKKMVDELYQCREDIRASDKDESSVLKFAMPHSLSMSFFPKWRSNIEAQLGKPCIKITTGNIHDSAQLLDSGNCDFVLYFDYEAMPTSCFNDSDFLKLKVGYDQLIPVSRANEDGSPLYNLDEELDTPIPYLAWGQPTLAHHVVTALIKRHHLDTKIRLRYQNQLAAAMHSEALIGNGIAWLSEGMVKQDLDSGALVRASGNYSIPIDIYIVRKSGNTSPLSKIWWDEIDQKHSL